MERIHQLLVGGNLDVEDDDFWTRHWHHIASAKVPLETKVAAYVTLKHRGVANSNSIHFRGLYNMVRFDRHFVAELGLEEYRLYCYRLFVMWIDDDVVALARYSQEMIGKSVWEGTNETDCSLLKRLLQHILMELNAPRCMRFLLQDKIFRESVMREQMSPLAQRLAEELVQPTDRLSRALLLTHGQSVKLIGMCVNDEELVAAWLSVDQKWSLIRRGSTTVMFARKIHALATPDQRQTLASRVRRAISENTESDGCFELVWLLGLFDPTIQKRFLRGNVSLFPAFTFAMIVAMCDDYLEFAHEITVTQRRFFDVASRLPMDLQALVALRLCGQTSTVIPSAKFDRALLVII